MRIDRPVALLVAIACSASIATAEDAEPVMVKDISVTPRANLVFADDTLSLHPKALLGLGYNSNIFSEADGDENDDVYVHGLVGLQGDWRLGPHENLGFNGELEVLSYADSDNDDGNLVGGLLTADYGWHDSGNDVLVHGGYARFDDPLIQSGEQILRQTIDGNVMVALQGASLRAVIDGGATAMDYLEDGIDFTEDSRDNTVYRLSGRVGLTTARETFYYALLSYDFSDYWDNIQYNDSSGITAGLGAQVRLGERSRLSAEGGVTYRMYQDDFGGQSAYDDETVIAPYLNIAAVWPWESGSQARVQAFSRMDESITSNAAWVYGLVVDGRYRLLARSGLFGSLAGYHSEDSGQLSGVSTEERDTVEASVGVDYEVTKGVIGRLKGTYTDSEAEVSTDFSRYIVALDFAVAF